MSEDEHYTPEEEDASRRPKRLPQVPLVRVLVVIGLLLALGATLVLVFTDSLAMLRFGLIGALWAGLAAAYVAARYRKDASVRSSEVENLHTAYELELEREISAHREREQELETHARKQAQEESNAQLAELRGELRVLREHLENLLGGEVLVERVALHAESTRMLGLGEHQQQRGYEEQRPRVSGGQPQVSGPQRRPANYPGGDRTMRHEPVSSNQQQQQRSGSEHSAAMWPSLPRTGASEEPRQYQSRSAQQPANQQAANPRERQPQEQQPQQRQPRPAQPPRAPEQPPRQPQRSGGYPQQPATAQPVNPAQQPPAGQPPAAGAQRDQSWRGEPARPEPKQTRQSSGNGHVPAIDPSWTPSWEAANPAQQRTPEPAPAEPAEPVSSTPDWSTSWQPEPPTENGASNGHGSSNGSVGGESESGGGRRRRKEGVSFAESFGQQSRSARNGNGEGGRHGAPASGGHAKPEPEPEPEPEVEPGAHAEGMAVSDLLAAHGRNDGTGGRRRRRAE